MKKTGEGIPTRLVVNSFSVYDLQQILLEEKGETVEGSSYSLRLSVYVKNHS